MIKEFIVNNICKLDRMSHNDRIVVGDEGCYACAFNENTKAIIQKAIRKGIYIRYVTPILTEACVDIARNNIINIANQVNLKVVFNDYGFLYLLRDYIDAGKIIPVLGRVLAKSLIDCPWYDKIICNEDKEINRAILGSTLYHESKIRLLNDLGISEVEINHYSDSYLSELKQIGLNITTYENNRLITIGRSCYWAIWNAGDIKKCNLFPQCDNEIFITLEKKWSKKNKMYIASNVADKLLYDNLYVLGNKVYQRIINTVNTSMVDYLICNKYYSED